MTDRLPSLSALRALEAAVRLGSVSRAGEELGRTHGAVSKSLRALEAETGLRLLERAGTGVKPTADGARLAGVVAEGLGALEARYLAAVRELRSPSVRVACSATFAMGWLVPRLGAFSAARPDVRISLSMTSARDMREERDADLVVLWDLTAAPVAFAARALRLGPCAFGLYARPDYPARIEGGRLVLPRLIGHDHTRRALEVWRAESGLALAADETLSFPHTHLCLGAAVAGLGAAVAERRFGEPHVEAGALARVGPLARAGDGYVAIPGPAGLTDAASAFVTWLREGLSAD